MPSLKIQIAFFILLPLLWINTSTTLPAQFQTQAQTALPAPAALLAFPEAQGGGRLAVGGRYGTVYAVTNLEDDGPGSLRAGLQRSNRTIVFRVSGIIHLKSTLKLEKDSITIAGQTAPGDGICLADYTFSIQASQVIIRHLRCRLGDRQKDADDAMHATTHGRPAGFLHDIIIDHCSLSWAVDEVGTFYGLRNFTLQWCIIAQSLFKSVHPKGIHGYGGIWGGDHASFHHNLIADNSSRNPRFGGSRYTGAPDKEWVDFRNNVIFNWGGINSVYGGEGGHYNMINNYYKPGPATPGDRKKSSSKNKRNRILNYTHYYYAKDAAVYPDTLWGGKFYIAGNFVEGYPDVSADNWTKGVQPDDNTWLKAELQKAKMTTPFEAAPVSTESAELAYQHVLKAAGATLPKRDSVDQQIIQAALTGKCNSEGVHYRQLFTKGVVYPTGIIDKPEEAGGFPVYRSLPAPPDSDLDGIPDHWEKRHGLNPHKTADGGAFGLDPHYSNLEVYLNAIATNK